MRANPYTTARDSAAPSPTELLRVSLLGLNAWVVTLLVPSLFVGLDPLQGLVTSAPLLVLGAGVFAHRRGASAAWWLLGGFPAAIGAVLAWRDELAARDAHGLLGLTFAALSLLAFAAAAAHASARDLRGARAEVQSPLGREAVIEPPARRWTRRALLGLSAAGALAITLVAPVLGGRDARVERWGEAADDAAVLTALVGGVVACLALGAVIGPSLRADRAPPLHPARRQRRLGAAMLIAVAAGVGWLLLRHFDALAGA